jgi:Tol biopolymer transport system component
MRRGRIAVALFFASAIFAQGSSSVADVSALPGHILFTRAGGIFGDETLYVANADGTGQRRISRIGKTCCPFATRSGSRIVFAGSSPDGRITAVTANLDGSRRTVLALPKGGLNLGSGPFSPNGKTLALEGFDDNDRAAAGIYLTRASDGKILRRVTRRHFIPGDFSPDGKQLVLFAGSEGEPPPPGSLWLVRTSGKGLHRLTPARVRVQCCGNYRYSPDRTKILFADADGVIWTIAPNGSNLTQVYKDDEGRYAITPTWSPDGSMIMFALDPTPNPFEHPVNSLYVIEADGTGLTKVIGGANFKREPIWVAR